MTGNRQLAAQIEQVVLNLDQVRRDRIRQRLGQQHAERRIELVNGADRVDSCAILGDARAVAQAGGSGVAGACDDLGQTVTHGAFHAERRGA